MAGDKIWRAYEALAVGAGGARERVHTAGADRPATPTRPNRGGDGQRSGAQRLKVTFFDGNGCITNHDTRHPHPSVVSTEDGEVSRFWNGGVSIFVNIRRDTPIHL